MLKVSKQAWHYRFCVWVSGLYGDTFSPAKSLCGYFWTVPFMAVALTLYPIFWVGRKLLPGFIPFLKWCERHSTFTIAVLALLIGVVMTVWAFTAWHTFWTFMVALGIAVVALVFIVGAFLAWDHYHEKKHGFDDEPRQKSMVLEYVRAKKQRVCPMIEYEP